MERTVERYLQSTHQTVEWFIQQFEQAKLVMKPAFQRNLVWLPQHKIYLIDSILQGYPIPEIYLQKAQDEAGRTTYAVVDGQQRITACLEFFNNQFELSGEKISPDLRELTFDDFSSDQKRRFLGYTFVVRTLPEMPDVEISEIFTRLNSNNLALNPQELRYAKYQGAFSSFIDSIAESAVWVQFGIFTLNDVRRMIDKEYISELTLGLLFGPQNKKLTLDRWYEVYQESFDEESAIRESFDLITGEIRQIFPDLNKHRWSKKSDFYTLFLALSLHQDKLPLASDRRDALRKALVTFGEEVNSYLITPPTLTAELMQQDEEELEEEEDLARQWILKGFDNLPDPDVIQYAAAVGRAASDLQPRRQRIAIVDKLINRVLSQDENPAEVAEQVPTG